jgi:hypothetical protein
MPSDFETFDDEKINFSKKRKNFKKSRSSNFSNSSNADFITMFYDLFNAINYKVTILLFLLGVILFSDIFIESFLIHISGAVDGDTPTSKGTTIQLLLQTIGYIVFDLLVSGNII